MNLRKLLFGHDTIECAYYLSAQGQSRLDFGLLSALKEGMRHSKRADAIALTLGGDDFLLQGYGTKSGYPYVIQNPNYSIQFGEFNSPSFFVTYRSAGLWQHGALGLHRRFVAWAEGLGFQAFRPEGLSRVDFTFDYCLPEIDFDEDSFVSLAQKDTQYRKDARIQSFQYGMGGDVVLRVYNKVDEINEQSAKTWFFDLWGVAEHVWRIEWQTRKDLLRRFRIRTFEELLSGQGDVLRYLAQEHDTLRVKNSDSNRSRWPLHPLWQDLQRQIAELDYQGVYREIDQEALLNERLMRAAISIYGYLKRVAALHGLQRGEDVVSMQAATERLQALIAKVHDPLTWAPDVRKRMDTMRLGQW